MSTNTHIDNEISGVSRRGWSGTAQCQRVAYQSFEPRVNGVIDIDRETGARCHRIVLGENLVLKRRVIQGNVPVPRVAVGETLLPA